MQNNKDNLPPVCPHCFALYYHAGFGVCQACKDKQKANDEKLEQAVIDLQAQAAKILKKENEALRGAVAEFRARIAVLEEKLSDCDCDLCGEPRDPEEGACRGCHQLFLKRHGEDQERIAVLERQRDGLYRGIIGSSRSVLLWKAVRATVVEIQEEKETTNATNNNNQPTNPQTP